jgi:hypothetical protein
MDVSDAITYSMKKEIKVAKWCTPKKYFKKFLICYKNISAEPRFKVIGMRHSNEDMF